MNWYIVDKKYINYLTQFDSHVGYVEYGERLKLHVGTLLTIGNFHYYVPISSAKPKHQKMSNSLDFHKLQSGFRHQKTKLWPFLFYRYQLCYLRSQTLYIDFLAADTSLLFSSFIQPSCSWIPQHTCIEIRVFIAVSGRR